MWVYNESGWHNCNLATRNYLNYNNNKINQYSCHQWCTAPCFAIFRMPIVNTVSLHHAQWPRPQLATLRADSSYTGQTERDRNGLVFSRGWSQHSTSTNINQQSPINRCESFRCKTNIAQMLLWSLFFVVGRVRHYWIDVLGFFVFKGPDKCIFIHFIFVFTVLRVHFGHTSQKLLHKNRHWIIEDKLNQWFEFHSLRTYLFLMAKIYSQ